MFYSYFAGLGLDVTVEDSASRQRLDSHGRLDMAVCFNGNVYLFEFKVVEMEREGAAMAQLKERGYADKYRHLGAADPPGCGGVQQGVPQRGGVRGGARGVRSDGAVIPPP